jgi:hypothetical protein
MLAGGKATVHNAAEPQRLHMTDTSLQCMVLVAAGVLLLGLFLLDPDPRGLGTHARLGMRECGYLQRNGVPCTACGATTSLAWFVRGEFQRAVEAHPIGVVMGTLLALSVPFSLLSVILGWPWLVPLKRARLPDWTGVVCISLGLLLVGWPQRAERYRQQQTGASVAVDSHREDCHGENGKS